MNPTWIYLKIKIGDFLFITTGEPDKLQKIYNHEEKEEVLSFRTSGGHKFSVAYLVCPWQLSNVIFWVKNLGRKSIFDF